MALILGPIILKAFKKKRLKAMNREVQKQLDLFKQECDKIEIDLNDIEVKTNKWTEEMVTDNSFGGGMDQLVGRGDLNIKKVNYNPNVLTLSVLYKESTIEVIIRVDMDTTSLELKLAIQKKSYLYINPNNPEEYYLDLDFLDNN